MIKANFFADNIARNIKPVAPAHDVRRHSCRTNGSSNGRKKNGNRKRNHSHGGQRARIEPDSSRPNLLILGASGHVAQAFLLRLAACRQNFGRLVLVDPNNTVLQNPYLDHALLDYEFVRWLIRFPNDAARYGQLLRDHGIDVVLDVTDLDTLPVLTATDEAGVSYVNTSLNESGRGIAEVVSDLHPTRTEPRRAPHILSSGMNPGVVNLWVWHGFQQHGVPHDVVHFEYDTSTPTTGWRPTITWSRKEFLTEAVWEPTGKVVDGELQMCRGNSLQHREDLRPIMEPVLALPEYPRGLLVLHEENVKLGARLGASSKYIYAIHPKTMEHLETLLRTHGRIEIADLEIADNTSVPLSGADIIGVCLKYPDKQVYYLNCLANRDIIGTSATCAQVAVGADAALQTLVSESLDPRIHFPTDLYDTVYSDVVFAGLQVEHSVFEKQNGRLVRRERVRWLRPSVRSVSREMAA